MKRWLLLTAIVSLFVLFYLFDLHQWLSFSALKENIISLQQQFTTNPLLFGGAFFVIYILVTALSIPGAVILTLAAGAIFGLFWGTIIVSFASTLGATGAFLASRYLFRSWVENKFSNRLATVNQGIKKDGAFYLFGLRLVPVLPFFLINILMGLTRFEVRRFYWVSQVGMLAGTLVYVNAGTQLAILDSAAGILSPKLIFSFLLLAIFPVIAKKFLAFIQSKKVYQAYHKPKHFDRNLVVIGAGAAGLVTSYIGAAVKAKVTLVESNNMGGDCLNYGCVPSKALIKSAKISHTMKHADHWGFEAVQPQASFQKVMQRVHQIIQAIAPHDSVERYTELGVHVVMGRATILDPWTVEIHHHPDGTGQAKTTKLTTQSIIIATGAEPFVPKIQGIENSGFVTSDTLWKKFATLAQCPKRIVVLGGGAIGCELSQSFARLGAEVIQVERGSRLLQKEDPEVGQFIHNRFIEEGVRVYINTEVLRFEQNHGNKSVVICSDGNQQVIPYDEVICAVGRVARLEGFGLEVLGIPSEKYIDTNEYLATIYPNIYAAGDVAGPYQLTHAAAHQAWYASVNALFGVFKKFKADYRVIPWTTFVDPEVARVGLNEQEAKVKNIPYEVTKYGLDDLDRAIAESEATGFVKVLTVPGKDQILGVCIVGAHAGEMLAEFVFAMKHGLGLNKVLATIHTYPTWSEANKYAAGFWKKAQTQAWVLNLLQKYHQWRRNEHS